MELRDYFEHTDGTGVLATCDAAGSVDTALYAAPHFMEDETIAFIMAERRSYANLRSNPNASYLFIESHPGTKKYEGRRLTLTMVREEQDEKLVESLRRKIRGTSTNDRHVVYFEIREIRPLVGDRQEK